METKMMLPLRTRQTSENISKDYQKALSDHQVIILNSGRIRESRIDNLLYPEEKY